MGRKGTKRTIGHKSEVKRQRKAGEEGEREREHGWKGKSFIMKKRRCHRLLPQFLQRFIYSFNKYL